MKIRKGRKALWVSHHLWQSDSILYAIFVCSSLLWLGKSVGALVRFAYKTAQEKRFLTMYLLYPFRHVTRKRPEKPIRHQNILDTARLQNTKMVLNENWKVKILYKKFPQLWKLQDLFAHLAFYVYASPVINFINIVL